MSVISGFEQKGLASVLVGGLWGSESKGSCAAWIAYELAKEERKFDIVTVNNGAQSGHVSIHKGNKRTLFHMPTTPYIAEDELGKGKGGTVYINNGAVIDPETFEKELNDNPYNGQIIVGPYAAVITDECKEAERRKDSGQTKIASTQKGVGEALARKALRVGQVAKDHPFLRKFTGPRIDLNRQLRIGNSVLIEIPQGLSLSLNHSGFYPYTTSRDCTPMQGMSDANVHPQFYNSCFVVFRSRAIRVGAILEGTEVLGTSGPAYADQREISWEELGVDVEFTTVTKRPRRVFMHSVQQFTDALATAVPDYVMLTFCNYLKEKKELEEIVDAIYGASRALMQPPPKIIYQWGPSSDDVGEEYDMVA